MQENCAPPHKVLVAVDGSEQSLRAIRYAAGVFPPDRTHIVLFHVRVKLVELFEDLAAYPHYKHQVTSLRRWATDQKSIIRQAMEAAVADFRQKGFSESAITVKSQDENLGIAQDIIKESYDGYHAIVVGRTGWSRFKDWLFKSTAMKLVAKVKHIPIVVVGGDPDAKNLLVAFDGTHGAMKGVACVGALVSTSDHHMQLYSMISHEGRFWVGNEEYFIPENAENPIETGRHQIGPHLQEARNRLIDEGMAPDRISVKIHAVDRDRPYRIVQEAMENHYGAVVLGRRGLITFIDEYFVGRISDQVLKLADQLAVWII